MAVDDTGPRIIRGLGALLAAGALGLLIWAVQVPSPAPRPSPAATASPVLHHHPTHARHPKSMTLFLNVQFVDPLHGFLLRCRSRAGRCPEELAITTDGGRTWRSVGPVRGVLALAFISPNTGFEIGSSCQKGRCTPTLLRTDDGGRSFQPVGPLPFSPVTEPEGENTSMSFVDGVRGWIATLHGVYATADGGSSWNRLSFQCPSGFGALGSVSFVDPQHGFVTCEGDPGADSSQKGLYRTDDAGQTWGLVSAEPLDRRAGRLPWIGTGAQISFFSDSVGFIVAGSHGLSRTEDGGRTFHPVFQQGEVAGTSWVSPTHGFLAVYQGKLLETLDGGAHWHAIGT